MRVSMSCTWAPTGITLSWAHPQLAGLCMQGTPCYGAGKCRKGRADRGPAGGLAMGASKGLTNGASRGADKGSARG